MKTIMLAALAAPLVLSACEPADETATEDNAAAVTTSDDAAMVDDGMANDAATDPNVAVDAEGNAIIEGAREVEATADAVGDAANSVDRAGDEIDGKRN